MASLPRDAWPEGYHATFNMGRLVTTVFLYTQLAQGGRTFGLAFPPGLQAFMVPIFPAIIPSVRWPSQVLDVDHYLRLIRTPPVAGVA